MIWNRWYNHNGNVTSIVAELFAELPGQPGGVYAVTLPTRESREITLKSHATDIKKEIKNSCNNDVGL